MSDSSGSGNDAVPGGNPTFVAGQIGTNAINLDGDDYIAIDGVVDDITSTDITLNVWINSTQTDQGDVIAANDGASGHPLEFYIDGGRPGRYDGSDIDYPNAPVVADGQWHMMTLVREGNEGRIYVDGVLAVTYSSGFSLASVTRWSIGQEWDGTTASNFYTGLVDDVRFYDGALSSDHVLGLFNGIEPSFLTASSPDPADGALSAGTWASLAWTAGDTAASHDVYMSNDFDSVNDGAADAFQGNQALPFFTVGFPGFAYPEGLVPGVTYYWRIDEVEADGTTKHRGPIWSFAIPSKTAYDPSPRNGGKNVNLDVTLSWTPGFGGKLHTVYFGDDLDTVSNAVGGIPQGSATFTPGNLEKDKVYYWRVDEFNPPETTKGNIWSFRTLPEIVITNPDMIGWWKFDNVSNNTVLDWSGYGNDAKLGGNPQVVEGAFDLGLDLRGADYVILDAVADDLTSRDFTVSAWIRTTQGGEGNVIASNNSASAHIFQFGIKGGGNVWVDDGPETQSPPAVNDDQWHMITFAKSGSSGVVYTDGIEVGRIQTTIDVTTETRWSIGQEWDGSSPSDFYVGMVDDVRFFNKALTQSEVAELMRGDPLVAWNPTPGNNREIDIEQAAQPFSWTAGEAASQHDVYFGTDKNAVDLADTSTTDIYRGRQAGTSYSPTEALEWGTGPYYWRVDEINADGSVSAGSIWSFSVADYLSVDDFESYNDIDPPDPESNRIFEGWLDGFGTTTNGALVGNDLPPYAERRIAYVHSGSQAMPFFYSNIGKSSEAASSLTGTSRDWTREGVAQLSLWFRGESTNTVERMYVALNGKAVYHDNPNAVQVGAYEEWVIPLQQLADLGVPLNNVTSIAIGFGTPGSAGTGGMGTVYIDDIRLYRTAP